MRCSSGVPSWWTSGTSFLPLTFEDDLSADMICDYTTGGGNLKKLGGITRHAQFMAYEPIFFDTVTCAGCAATLQVCAELAE